MIYINIDENENERYKHQWQRIDQSWGDPFH